MMVEEQAYLIGELARLSGVSVRTIRYYLEEGLLPTPRVQGKYSVYDEEYTDRIQLIRYLKNAYLPLREIRRLLENLEGREVKEMLGRYERGEYVQMSSNVEVYSPDGQSAVDYINNVLKKQPLRERSEPSRAAQGKAPAPPRQPAPSFSAKAHGTGSTWRRVVIAPGVELHIDEALFQGASEQVDNLLLFARKLFTGG
jgi:DNA-binding transcriptional MerR regulator